MTATTLNPLLGQSRNPDFDVITADHIGPAVDVLLPKLDAELVALEAQLEADAEPEWEATIRPLERINDQLAHTWKTIRFLLAVRNSEALRTAYEAVEGRLVAFSVRSGQSRPLYNALCALRDGPKASSLTPAQQRILAGSIRSARNSGVGLNGAEKERFNAIQGEEAELGTRFANNVLDSVKAWSEWVDDLSVVAGIPESALRLAAANARENGGKDATPETGPWRFTLDHPSLLPVLRYAENRDLREKVYRAFTSIASEGDSDNGPLIERILALRLEESQLLGYEDFAELSLSNKMAPNVAAVETLLESLRTASFDAAKDDLTTLQSFANNNGFEAELRHWDMAFWAERQREKNYGYSDEELRPYFPVERVLDGLFALTKRLFDVDITPADGDVPVWHDDIRYFTIKNSQGEGVAAFYLDLYTRPAEKSGGAFHMSCMGRSRSLALEGTNMRNPVSYMVCNQAPPVDDVPALMTFVDVTTIFHEFGHGLHHMLTTVDEGMAAGGANVEWDAIELPSLFMENWCYQRDVIKSFSNHYETGESLPDELIDKVLAAKNYRAGSAMLRQLSFGFVDLALHHGYEPDGDETPLEVESRVRARTTVINPLPEDRFLCSFKHIFAGGYAAGYYSYKWAEVLSADAFAAFEEVGLDDEAQVRETGRRYRESVLALGGSVEPMEIFRKFRGREPNTEALLRHSGLA